MKTDLTTTIEELIGRIDQTINAQVNAILHHPRFQRLESAWRGVMMLVTAVDKDKRIKIKLLNFSERELAKDILTAIEFDHAQIFKKVYTNEFDQPGGEPYGLLIGDYYFSHKPTKTIKDGIGVLLGMSKVAASAFAPFITAIAPSFFGIDRFTEFPIPFKIDDLVKHPEYLRWQRLCKDTDARFLGLVLPRILLRPPHNDNGVKLTNRFFSETINDHDEALWGNASYAFACVAIRCFKETGWFADIKGISPDQTSGGTVDLVRQYYKTDPQGFSPKFATEFYLTDQHEKILSDAGFIALRDIRQIEKGIFYSCPSIQQPSRQYDRRIANTNAKIATMLHYVLCASRFAQYVKVIVRDKVGSFMNAVDCQNFLYSWLNQYTTNSAGLSATAQAKYPLNEIKVLVNEVPGSPGKFNCTMHLKPHYQLDSINTHLKLVTHLKLA